ncbi:MAG: uncharacterized protein QOF33_1246 [Thermomicrobiales bacterium]|nr:uncharacterized protein [Thermomicrobiales bacterium]
MSEWSIGSQAVLAALLYTLLMRPASLAELDHRPWLLPSGSWQLRMSWRDLLFAHWPLTPDTLRPLIPRQLTLDTYGGDAWVGVVPFRMSAVVPRFAPPTPWFSAFLELNVRTYVTIGGKPGVWFFSLDAANPVAVAIARRWFHLPYFRARMRLRDDGDWIAYESRRTHRGVPPGEFRGRYRPTGSIHRSEPGSLDAWLTERYALYAADPLGRVFRGDIHHVPWPLQSAEAELTVNTVCDAHGFTLPDVPPLLHFARRLDVLAWTPVRVG